MQPVRVGVIGIGNMGWHHARVLSLLRDAELVGVADPDPKRGQLAVEQFGCRWFPSYEEMLPEVEMWTTREDIGFRSLPTVPRSPGRRGLYGRGIFRK